MRNQGTTAPIVKNSSEVLNAHLNFDTFLELCHSLNVKYFRVTNRKDGINIVLGINKKMACFGRADNFASAFQKLLVDLEQHGIEIPEEKATA
ncbi:hypothetical protein [Riemerella anatipestifer]|uniref:hypothetical protein n=1 Tax=Riemerella anatipestifer TaxID=34085 RepID=UPI001C1E302A|nr:hypothetical protein [Riemerella anatipestifer]MCW0492477.1 hypothetical protein [Riemerella anatipestifer]MDR7749944.1 hypothetical protein [Riemerella anatipestifer]MDR7752178.1 hypothetical protein [Riemerella anatipestifer]MDR7754175.1 hypothetical protein [Riemerella anatipestifer]MDR7758444.1 hypothetical protein [Riemerella anatipestifer]